MLLLLLQHNSAYVAADSNQVHHFISSEHHGDLQQSTQLGTAEHPTAIHKKTHSRITGSLFLSLPQCFRLSRLSSSSLLLFFSFS